MDCFLIFRVYRGLVTVAKAHGGRKTDRRAWHSHLVQAEEHGPRTVAKEDTALVRLLLRHTGGFLRRRARVLRLDGIVGRLRVVGLHGG